MRHDHGVVGVEVSSNGGFERLSAGIGQGRRLPAIKVRLDLSANLLELLLGYGHKLWKAQIFGHPSIVISQAVGSLVSEHWRSFFTLRRNAFLNVLRVGAGLGQRSGMVSIQRTGLKLSNDFKHTGHRHRRQRQ